MGVPSFFRLCGKLFPLPADYADSGKSLEELSPVYRRWELYSLPLLFGLAPPFAAAWWWILHQIGCFWHTDRFPDAVFHFWPMGIVWGVPAILLGILSTVPPICAFYRWRLKDRYSEFVRYQNLRHGYNQKTATIPVCFFFGTLVLLVVLLVLDWHVVLTKDEIIVQPLFGFSTVTHTYGEITEIRTAPVRRAPNGKLVDNDDYEVEFSDGFVWSTYFCPADLHDGEKRDLAQFVSEQCEKPIHHLPVLERGG